MVSNPAYSSPDFLEYRPGAAKDSGDLEGGTKTVSATSEPGAFDYSIALNVPASPDSDLEVVSQGLRLLTNIVSFDGAPAATQLNVSVRRAGGSNFFTGAHVSTGNQVAHGTISGGDLAFGSQTYEIRYWVDQGSVDIDVVQLWKAIGATVLAGMGTEVFRIHRRGLYLPMMRVIKTGAAGVSQTQLHHPSSSGFADSTLQFAWNNIYGWLRTESPLLSAGNPGYVSLLMNWGTDGDLAVLEEFGVIAGKL